MPPKKRDASGAALTIVNTVWALVIGTLMLRWIQTDLYPHLIADGSLDGDLVTLGVTFAVSVVLAVPSVFKSRVVNLLEATKEWNKVRKESGK